MNISSTIKIEDKNYPKVILGGDRFCGAMGKSRHSELQNRLTEPDYIYKIMKSCYDNGFRGFDISAAFDKVIIAFKKLKKKHPDAIGILNPNWNIYTNLDPLRALSTVFKDIFNDKTFSKIRKLSDLTQKKKFPYKNTKYKTKEPLTRKEIDYIGFDKELLKKYLNKVKDVCDFCVVGSGPADYLPLFGRLDIFEDMIKIERNKGFIPMSIHHYTSIVLPLLDKLDFAGHWTYLNKKEQILSEEDVIKTLKNCKRPITAFKALLSREEKDIREYLDYLLNNLKVDAIDFGVETVEESELINKIISNL